MRKGTLIAVLAVGAVSACGITGFIVWRKDITFAVDRANLKGMLSEMGHDVFDSPLPPVKVEGPREITPVPPSPTNLSCTIDGHTLAFPKGSWKSVDAGRAPMRVFENNQLMVVVSASTWNHAIGLSPEDLSSLGAAWGGEGVLRHFTENDPFEVARSIYEASFEAIDAPEDLETRYLNLYLYGQRTVLAEKGAGGGVAELSAPSFRAFMAGDITQGDVYLEIYCRETKKFVEIMFRKKEPATNKDIELFLAGLTITPTEPAGDK